MTNPAIRQNVRRLQAAPWGSPQWAQEVEAIAREGLTVGPDQPKKKEDDEVTDGLL